MSLHLYRCIAHKVENCDQLLCVRRELVPLVESEEQELAIVEAAHAAWFMADDDGRAGIVAGLLRLRMPVGGSL